MNEEGAVVTCIKYVWNEKHTQKFRKIFFWDWSTGKLF